MTTVSDESKGKAGAPIGNQNRVRHGKRGWLAIKRLPKGCTTISRALYEERDLIVAAATALHGSMNLYHLAVSQSAIRNSGTAQLLERWLRLETGLSLADRLAVLREIRNATEARDKCLQRLGLDVPPKDRDPWAALDVPSTPTKTGDKP